MDNRKNLYIRNGVLVLCDTEVKGEVVIPDGVTVIDDGAFKHCFDITTIKIPNTVKKIRTSAFSECINLVKINIPNSVTYIGDYAFQGCTSLTTINIPKTVTTIWDYVFQSCVNLKNIKIPNSVTYIGYAAFAHCEKLETINIPKSVTDIRGRAFVGCPNLNCNQFNKYKKKILAYKGFDSNLSCRGFNYKVGKLYHEDKAIACECGFHACINPLDVVQYYPNENGNRFALVELSGDIDFSEVQKLTKLAATDIRIIKELTFKDLINDFNRLNN